MAKPEHLHRALYSDPKTTELSAQVVLEAVLQVIEEEKVEKKEKNDGN